MSRKTCKNILRLFVAVILLQLLIFAQDPPKNDNRPPQKATSDVRIQVTGGEDRAPIKGATVYMEWKDEGETKRKEGPTNRNGVAGPYKLPRGKVFIQIRPEGGEWQRQGGEFELKEPTETITVNLTRRAQ